jgi:hypothetical protein
MKIDYIHAYSLADSPVAATTHAATDGWQA